MTLTHKRKSIFSRLPIRVHSWGGLGSQIFACVIARRLKARFPNRRIVLVFHSAGVTYRGQEVNENLTSSLSTEFVDDYRSRELDKSVEPENESKSLKRVLLKIMENCGFLARLNEEQEFVSISSRVLEVRGHYTRMQLTRYEIDWVADSLNLMEEHQTSFDRESIAIHLRLGDLLTLKSKDHINLDRLDNATKLVQGAKKLVIYSDSEPEVVLPLLERNFSKFSLEVLKVATPLVMSSCMKSRVFIGTNSKISIWIAVLRLSLNLGEVTILPKEIASQTSLLLKSISSPQQLVNF